LLILFAFFVMKPCRTLKNWCSRIFSISSYSRHSLYIDFVPFRDSPAGTGHCWEVTMKRPLLAWEQPEVMTRSSPIYCLLHMPIEIMQCLVTTNWNYLGMIQCVIILRRYLLTIFMNSLCIYISYIYKRKFIWTHWNIFDVRWLLHF
jgi:hypothetical protein